MPKMNLERAGKDRPLLSIPPSGTMAGGIAPPVQVFLELGKAEAGCYICRRPIPAGSSRIAFTALVDVHDPNPAPDAAWTPVKTRTQKYYVHPGCLTKGMGGEVVRQGIDCWDCGAEGIWSDRKELLKPGWAHCFTTHKFAWGALCERCQKKPKWLLCGHCEVWYPLHMVSKGRLPDDRRRRGIDEDHPRQEEGDWCMHCADRFGVLTMEQMKEARSEFEETLRRIKERGVFE